MSKKKKGEGEEAKQGGKKKLIGIGAVVIVGFLAGGKLMGGKSAPAAGGVVATTTTVPGPVVALDPITLNLSDGRLLKVGVALQLSAEEAAGGGEGHGTATTAVDSTKGYARALDQVIATFSTRTYEELMKPEGRAAAKISLLKRLHKVYHEQIKDVYFHQFVMQ